MDDFDIDDMDVGDVVVCNGHGFLLCEFVCIEPTTYHVYPVGIGTDSKYNCMSGMHKWSKDTPKRMGDEGEEKNISDWLVIKKEDCRIIRRVNEDDLPLACDCGAGAL